MTVAFLDEFRGPPLATCKRCGNHERLREVRVSGKAEMLCKTCRAVLDCEPVWVDHREYRVPRHNAGIDDV